MKKVAWLALLLPLWANAAPLWSGYVQEHLSHRTRSAPTCVQLRDACHFMANEQRLQLLAEAALPADVNATLRVDATNDVATHRSTVLVREAYLDWTLSPVASVRAGRQVITWGVADYLFVNDIFPKNYDAFFSGKPFDHMKEAVDAIKFNGVVHGVELDLVLSRPQMDQAAAPARFNSMHMPPPVAVSPATRHGVDSALRLGRKFGRWDTAAYLARYQSRDGGLFASAPLAMTWQSSTTRHAGASVTGPLGQGVVLGEVAYMKVDQRNNNFNRYHTGSQMKGLVGYAHEFGDDLSASLQYHIESSTDHHSYRASLAAGVIPADRHRQTVYLRVQKRMLHQTLTIGTQAFAALEGGNHLNPFASYAIADGLTLEGGANLFNGASQSRYGMMKHDSNVYSSLRFSF
jgi:hypothetical protein